MYLHWYSNSLIWNRHVSVTVIYIFMDSHSSKQHLQYESYLGWALYLLNTAGCIQNHFGEGGGGVGEKKEICFIDRFLFYLWSVAPVNHFLFSISVTIFWEHLSRLDKLCNHIRFEVLMGVSLEISVFWKVMLCSSLVRYHHFRGTCYPWL